jgi:TPR repeat protein
MHLTGQGEVQDTEAAFRLFKRAGEGGNTDGLYNVALMKLQVRRGSGDGRSGGAPPAGDAVQPAPSPWR